MSLIESILLRFPIPEVYVQIVQAPSGVEEFGVVDGQQRLRTILQFIGIEAPKDQIDGEDSNHFDLEQLADASPYKDLVFRRPGRQRAKEVFSYEICVR